MLTLNILPENATNKSVTWTSDDESVAMVMDGMVIAMNAGMANITVTTVDGEKTATCLVVVSAATHKITLRQAFGGTATITPPEELTAEPDESGDMVVDGLESSEQKVTLSAEATKAGYVFGGWQIYYYMDGPFGPIEDLVNANYLNLYTSLENPAELLASPLELGLADGMDAQDLLIMPYFAKPVQVDLAVNDADGGIVSSETTGLETFVPNGLTPITVKAEAKSGYYFKTWTVTAGGLPLVRGEDYTLQTNGTEATITFMDSVDKDVTITAVFFREGDRDFVAPDLLPRLYSNDAATHTNSNAVMQGWSNESGKLVFTLPQVYGNTRLIVRAFVDDEDAAVKDLVASGVTFHIQLSGEEVAATEYMSMTAYELGDISTLLESGELAFTVTDRWGNTLPGVLRLAGVTAAVTGVTLDQTEAELQEGKTLQLTATVAPEDAEDKTVTWTSSDETVATVADGLVTAVGAGSAEIAVTTREGGFTAVCAVTVTEAAEPAEEYAIETPVLTGTDGSPLTEIPDETFLITIPVKKLAAGEDSLILLASYGAGGQFKGLMYVKIKDAPVGSTVEITLPVDNKDGEIVSLKVFAVSSLGSFTPLGEEKAIGG